jgi:hypothetical protein
MTSLRMAWRIQIDVSNYFSRIQKEKKDMISTRHCKQKKQKRNSKKPTRPHGETFLTKNSSSGISQPRMSKIDTWGSTMKEVNKNQQDPEIRSGTG